MAGPMPILLLVQVVFTLLTMTQGSFISVSCEAEISADPSIIANTSSAMIMILSRKMVWRVWSKCYLSSSEPVLQLKIFFVQMFDDLLDAVIGVVISHSTVGLHDNSVQHLLKTMKK